MWQTRYGLHTQQSHSPIKLMGLSMLALPPELGASQGSMPPARGIDLHPSLGFDTVKIYGKMAVAELAGNSLEWLCPHMHPPFSWPL